MKHAVKTLAISFLILVVLYFAYGIFFLERVLPNTYFASINLGGKKIDEAREIIDKSIDSYTQSDLTFVLGKQQILVKPTGLGVEFDKEMSVKSVLSNNESSNFIKEQIKKTKALFFKEQIQSYYTVDNEEFDEFLDSVIGKFERPATNASITFSTGGPQVSASRDGVVVDKIKFIDDLDSRLDVLSTFPISLNFVQDQAAVSDLGAEKALEKVRSLSNQTVVFNYKYDSWRFSNQKLFDLLKFEPEGFGDDLIQLQLGQSPILVKDIKKTAAGKAQLLVTLDEEKVDKLIEDISVSVNQPTVDATLEVSGNKVTRFIPAQDGQVLDAAVLKKLLLDKISIESISQDKVISIDLPVKVTKAKIANQEVNNLGIVELLGTGVSYFAGSIANRIHNIVLGTSLINGTIVAPGEVFSFNALVGPVSAEQGFKQAYVIQKGRTVLDDGGGICQVSTTVFRAALNSGLPIVKRTAHAYRVSYYEQRGFKPGFDATIFSPSVDLQFKNDTSRHILVQAKVDKANARLQVDIYGTSDGRRVEISEPVVSNVTPPPEPKYEEDATLAKGTVKQVDFAAHGATSIFTRKVYRGSELIINDTIRSNFRPWQAVYLVGTGG